ncbi:PQQ-binding-like beta-propeller repeat protein [Streptomyces iranensis]|uniref:Nucleoside phosphorylase/outer membrane protein assembly factor BamB n=1 Tax=Streptomyces iranensis TaxID=576784 RepID=A0ABS4N2C7_9ACTN|nr:PQQ-binding-like beta-propeller repeat protein [Streptomyces iranensis]MBP2066176.1 nucleoside phosphorylase/outer membrane protein assembly factor BamB [Streptomyces iranensis]
MSSTVVILTALGLEFQSVQQYLSGCELVRHQTGTVFEVGTLVGTPWRVALAEVGEGNRPAAVVTEQARQLFSPAVLLFVGVAGALKDDVELGDVVVATRVHAFHGGKDTPEGFMARPEGWAGSHALVQTARHALRAASWQPEPTPGNTEVQPGPHVHFKPIAAGDIVLNSSTSELRRQLHAHYNDAAAIEMESAGMAHAAQLGHIAALTIRGISDKADGNKYADADAEHQPRAAAHAAAAAVAVIRHLPAPPMADAAPFTSSPLQREGHSGALRNGTPSSDHGSLDGSRQPRRTRRRLIISAATVVAIAAVGAGIGVWRDSLWERPPADSKAKKDAKNSAAAWETDLAQIGVANALENEFRCTAAADKDLLCMMGENILKVDSANGRVRWRFGDQTFAESGLVGAVESDGAVYAQARKSESSQSDGIVALDPATGRVKRTYAVPDPGGPLVVTDSGVIVRSGTGELRLVNARSPRTLARWKVDAGEIGEVASNGKEVLVTVNERNSGDWHMEATNSSLSTHLMSSFAEGKDVPRPPLSPIGNGIDTFYLAGGTSGSGYEAVYRSAPGGNGTAMDFWRRTPLNSVTNMPMTASDDFVYAPSTDGTITAIDCRRDRVAWRKDSGARGISEVAVKGGKLLLSDAQGRLHSLDALTGRHLSTGAPHRGTMDADSQRHAPAPVVIGKSIYVVTPGNTLYRTSLPVQN